jgi:putative salt-induced outer membrane protein
VAAPLAAQISPDSLGWRFTGAAGYVQTSGNTKVSSVTMSDRLLFRPSTRWQFSQTAAWVYAKTDSLETANQILGRLRADYYVSARFSVYGFGGYERNRFAGIDSRYEAAAGLGWQALRTAKHEMDVEAGGSYNSQRSPNTPLDDFVSSRLAGRYRFSFGSRAYLEEAAELLSNLEDTGDQRLNSTTALVAPISTAIGIRVGYLIRYDAEPPAGFEKLDTTFSTGLQFTF